MPKIKIKGCPKEAKLDVLYGNKSLETIMFGERYFNYLQLFGGNFTPAGESPKIMKSD